jgi:hypothetical protein
MGLLSGSVSVTRFNVVARPVELAFDEQAFREIPPGSEVRESAGFVAFEPGAGYQTGHQRWPFRVRVDRLAPDATSVAERVRQLVAAEREATGAPTVGSRRRRRLRELAEEELIVRSSPRSRIVEGVVAGDVVYVGSTAKGVLGTVVGLLRRIGLTAEPKAPWVDRKEQAESDLLELSEPGQSVLGCRFLAALAGEPELTFEPVDGSARLRAGDTRVSLAGAVLGDLLAYLDRGAEVLTARLTTGEVSFRLDGTTWRVSALRVPPGRRDHWAEALDERLEAITAVFELLDAHYARLDPASRPAPVRREAHRPQESVN